MSGDEVPTTLERLGSFLERPGATLLVLRAFLGVTFSFAGLQKLANPNFFRKAAPGSFYAQLTGAISTSPLHHLLDVATHAPTLVAVVISIGELAVGLGTLAGLFGRLAALGGMLLALSFFLTVSYNDSPYYYGPDIVFLFAWTPLALAGPGEFSLDHLLVTRAAALRASTPRGPASRELIERRIFLQRATTTGVLAALAAVAGGLDAGLGRTFSPKGAKGTTSSLGQGGAGASPTTTTAAHDASGRSGSPTTTTAAHGVSGGSVKGTRIGPAADVPVGGAASFTDPKQQIPAYVVQPTSGHYVAFSAICTHAGCTVNFDQSSDEFVCPCHGSVYNAVTGAVISGPAPSPLPSIPVALGPDGQLYADG